METNIPVEFGLPLVDEFPLTLNNSKNSIPFLNLDSRKSQNVTKGEKIRERLFTFFLSSADLPLI